MPSDKQVKTAVIGYILFQLMFNLLLWIPVFYEVQKQLGLSDPEIFHIQSIYYLVFCFLEIPTGFIADRYGYKKSMLWGSLSLVFANALPIFAGTYVGFLAHFCLIALARSLISGASSAWLYDYLASIGRADKYKQVEGDARFYSLVARVVSWAAVGWLMQRGLMLPYWISAANALLAALLVMTLPALPLAPSARTLTLVSNLRSATAIVLRTPILLLLMLQGVGIFILVRVMQVNLYQPVLTMKSFDVTTFGLIMSVMTIFEAIGSKQAWRMRKLFSDLTSVLASTLVICACLVAIALGNQIAVIAAFCIFSLAAGVAFPVQKQVLNEAISVPGKRATILSVESIVDRGLCAIVVLPLGGFVADGLLSETLIMCGLGFALAAISVQVMIRKTTRTQTTAVMNSQGALQ